MRKRYTPFILLFILPLFNSCVVNADFDQINLDIEPEFSTPLVYFELNQLDFLDDTGTIEIESISDLTDLEIFQSTTVRDNLIRVDFQFEIRNTFDRRFVAEMELLSANDDVVFAFNPLFVQESEQTFFSRQEIIISENPNILNTRKARVKITLVPVSTSLDPDVERKLEFRSTGEFFLRL